MKTKLHRRWFVLPQLLLPLLAVGVLVSSIRGQAPANLAGKWTGGFSNGTSSAGGGAPVALPPAAAAAPGTPDDDFYMIFTGDTQFPWSDVEAVDAKGNPVTRTDPNSGAPNHQTTDLYSDATEDPAKRAFSEKMNKQQVTSMLSLATQLNLKGVVINGDLTAYGTDQTDCLTVYQSMYENVGLPIYSGLGNHDYSNNVPGCNSCADAMIQYMYTFINKLNPPNRDINESAVYYQAGLATKKYRGSMAYSWDIGNVHFVQLHFHPAYARTWSTFNASTASEDVDEITSAMDWLNADLAKARNAGKAIVLNMHDALGDSSDSWAFGASQFSSQFTAYQAMIQKYGVSAVFGAHVHQLIGLQAVQNGVPVFLPGGADYSTYLLVHFKGNTMTVEQVSSTDGSRKPVYGYANGNYFQDGYSMQLTGMVVGGPVKVSPTGPPRRDGTNVYPLNESKPSTPFPVVEPSKMEITFFNQGGYVANFTLTYTANGSPVTDNSGNLSLGMTAVYDIPSGATNITVAGSEDTGLTWAPTKQIFRQPLAFGPSTCFKSYGTTLSPSWNHDCSVNPPAPAQAGPAPRTITFSEQAGFVADMAVVYTPAGATTPATVNTGNLSVGQSRSLQIPATQPNTPIIVTMTGVSTMNNNFFQTTVLGTFTGDVCFKAWGTLFSPQGGGC